MAFADEAVMQIAEAQHAGNRHANSDRLYVRFGLHPVKDEEKTKYTGRPVYSDVEFVRLMVPGDKNNVIHRPATDEDRRIYAKQYEAFKAGTSDGLTGTPLREWALITRSEAEMLAYYKVLTVEQLAALSDGAIGEIGPIRHLVEKAKKHVSDAEKSAPAEKLASELKARDEVIANLQKQMDALQKQVRK